MKRPTAAQQRLKAAQKIGDQMKKQWDEMSDGEIAKVLALRPGFDRAKLKEFCRVTGIMKLRDIRLGIEIADAAAVQFRGQAEKQGELVEAIARKTLDIETLETRNMDGLDFHEVAVWEVKRALEAAYKAGQEAGK